MRASTRIDALRYHDISCGHRVVGHENKCALLHGHNYRVHFAVASSEDLDSIGRVLDFSVINERLCMWLEQHWDHKFLAWEHDPLLRGMQSRLPLPWLLNEGHAFEDSIVWTPFNPTAENMAAYLLEVVGPEQLRDTGVYLRRVRVEETRKCSAVAQL